MRLQVAALAGIAVPIGAAWGARALVVYAFFALLVVVLVHGAAVAGELIAAVSRSRFNDRDERR
jgi:hypothetical protein